jgi:hypothetical protein
VLRRSVPELQYPLSVLVLGMVDRSTEEGRQPGRGARNEVTSPIPSKTVISRAYIYARLEAV